MKKMLLAAAAMMGFYSLPDRAPHAPRPTPRRKHRAESPRLHDTTRFARKSHKHGSGYHPGKLFKGHRA